MQRIMLVTAVAFAAGVATVTYGEEITVEDYGLDTIDPSEMSIGVKGQTPLVLNFAEGDDDDIAEFPDGSIEGADASEIARQTSNPLGGDFMILINEFQFAEKKSDIDAFDDGESFTYVFQPVIPISMEEVIGPNWILVNRPTFVWVDTDVPELSSSGPGLGSIDGFGDISHFSLLGTSTPSENDLLGSGDTVLAAGFSVNIPVGDSDVTNDTWALGPAAVAAYIGEKGILGGLLQTQFDFVDSGSTEYNRAFFQPFYYKNFSDGWQVGGAPLMVFDFDSDEHSIPIGLGVQKTHVFDLNNGGKLPVRFGVEARYFVEQPDAFGDDWAIVFSISPVIPNIVSNWINGCPAMSMGGC